MMNELTTLQSLYPNESFEGDIYTCPVCGRQAFITYDGEQNEAYLGSCECGQHFNISAYYLDAIRDEMSEEELESFNEHDFIQETINTHFNKLPKARVKTFDFNGKTFGTGQLVNVSTWNSSWSYSDAKITSRDKTGFVLEDEVRILYKDIKNIEVA
jgi:hypothetical protein